MFAVLAVVVLVMAITAIPLVAPLPWGLVAHFECGPGATVATVDLWTPVALVNAPFGGSAEGWGSFGSSGRSGTTVENGSAGGIFQLMKWAVTTSVRVLVAGSGPNAVCSGYLASYSMSGNYMTYSLYAPANATSDAVQNTSYSAYGYPSVLFDNRYVEEDTVVDTCGFGLGTVVAGVQASWMTLGIPFTLGGRNETASATLEGTFNWTYTFPGNFGTWSVDALDAGAHAPGGGWAFSFSPCP